MGFEKELADLINKYSLENGSDTPDWILAEYVEGCLDNFNLALSRRTNNSYKPDFSLETVSQWIKNDK